MEEYLDKQMTYKQIADSGKFKEDQKLREEFLSLLK